MKSFLKYACSTSYSTIDTIRFGVWAVLVSVFGACSTEGVKLDRGDRLTIDTTTSREISRITPELDAWCRDSTEALVQKLVDSLVQVREQEIMLQSPIGQ